MIPEEDGWYWCRYAGKHGVVVCPCEITHIGKDVIIKTARNDTWIPSVSKWKIKIGPKIPVPQKGNL